MGMLVTLILMMDVGIDLEYKLFSFILTLCVCLVQVCYTITIPKRNITRPSKTKMNVNLSVPHKPPVSLLAHILMSQMVLRCAGATGSQDLSLDLPCRLLIIL